MWCITIRWNDQIVIIIACRLFFLLFLRHMHTSSNCTVLCIHLMALTSNFIFPVRSKCNVTFTDSFTLAKKRRCANFIFSCVHTHTRSRNLNWVIYAEVKKNAKKKPTNRWMETRDVCERERDKWGEITIRKTKMQRCNDRRIDVNECTKAACYVRGQML